MATGIAILVLLILMPLVLPPLSLWAFARLEGVPRVSFIYAIGVVVASGLSGLAAGVAVGALYPGLTAVAVSAAATGAVFCVLLSRGGRTTMMNALGILLLSQGLVIVLVVAMRMWVGSPFEVKGEAMEPTFYSDDLLIVDKLSYRFQEPRRGDVIVLIPPSDTKQFYVKRIVGLPGEAIQFRDGEVVLFTKEHPEGQTLAEEYIPVSVATFGPSPERIEIPADSFFALGDNREFSNDSRNWRELPRANIVGLVSLALWPDIRVVERPVFAL